MRPLCHKIKLALAIAAGSFGSISLPAQGFLLQSSDELGRQVVLFCDNDYPEWYSFKVLEDELLRVRYDCALALEDNPSEMIRAEYRLQIGRRHTKFVSTIRHRVDSLRCLGGHMRGKLYEGKANPVFVEDCYYLDRETGRLTFTGRLAAEDLLYEERIPDIEWRVLDSTKVLCGYLCRKAEGAFRGRNYTVWFTEDIPYSAGPWKLQGLPGVILEAEDSERLHLVKAIAVYPGNGKIIKTDYSYIKVTRKQYSKLVDQYLDEPSIYMSNHASRVKAYFTFSPEFKPTPLRRPVMLEKE